MDRARSLVAAVLVLGACADDKDDRPAEWPYIAAAIIQPNCASASCHSNLTRTGGLVLEEANSSCVTLRGYEPDGNFVVPGNPTESKLVALLRGDETWRMPPDLPLPEADIQLIEKWILLGAECK